MFTVTHFPNEVGQSSRDNNSDLILLWRHLINPDNDAHTCELHFGDLTTAEEELDLFSHLGGSRPVGTRRCIVWLLHIAICAIPNCSTLHCIAICAIPDCSGLETIACSSTFPVLMRADAWAQELASYRMPIGQLAESTNYLLPRFSSLYHFLLALWSPR